MWQQQKSRIIVLRKYKYIEYWEFFKIRKNTFEYFREALLFEYFTLTIDIRRLKLSYTEKINNFSPIRIIAYHVHPFNDRDFFQCFSHVNNYYKWDAPQTAIFFCHRHGRSVICDWMMTKSTEIVRVFRANRALAYEGGRMRDKATGQHMERVRECESVSRARDKAQTQNALIPANGQWDSNKNDSCLRVFRAPRLLVCISPCTCVTGGALLCHCSKFAEVAITTRIRRARKQKYRYVTT